MDVALRVRVGCTARGSAALTETAAAAPSGKHKAAGNPQEASSRCGARRWSRFRTIMPGPALARIGLTSYGGGVYEPSEDSFALADALAASLEAITNPPPALCLEVGGGSGYVIASLALMLAEGGHRPHCLATDLSTFATSASLETVRAHQIDNVEVLRTDLVSGLTPRLSGCVDIMVFNPPYVPTPDHEVPASQWTYEAEGCGVNAAWAGGMRGRLVIDRLLPLVPKLLSPTGHFFMVTVRENDPEELLRILEGESLHGRVAIQRGADEEFLQILHFSREPPPKR